MRKRIMEAIEVHEWLAGHNAYNSRCEECRRLSDAMWELEKESK